MIQKKYEALITIKMVVEAVDDETAYLRIERMQEKLGSYPDIKIELKDISPVSNYIYNPVKRVKPL